MNNSKIEEYLKLLKQGGFAPDTATGSRENFAVDGNEPDVVISPKSFEETAQAVRSAQASGIPVFPCGGLTRSHIGNPVDDYALALNTKNLNSVIEYEPAELLIVTSAGITIGEINKVLSENNQILPLNPPDLERATIGGTLASNAYGYLRDTYGSARDMTLGLHAVMADGSSVKSGGKVAKNVAGYDLTRLMIGSWGTLGIVTQAALRVQPMPELYRTFLAGFRGINDAIGCSFRILDSHFKPLFLMLLNGALMSRLMSGTGNSLESRSSYYIVMGIDGLPETVKWQERELTTVVREYHAGLYSEIPENTQHEVRSGLQNCCSGDYEGIICKVVSTRSGTEKLLRYLDDTIDKPDNIEIVSLFGSGGTHILFPGFSDTGETGRSRIASFIGALRAQVKKQGGSLTLEKAPVALKNSLGVWEEFPGESLMRKLKLKLDPANLLNPERFIRVST
ncbi:FAD-binding oxidoreductase [candidate division KSB1 bacterium]